MAFFFTHRTHWFYFLLILCSVFLGKIKLALFFLALYFFLLFLFRRQRLIDLPFSTPTSPVDGIVHKVFEHGLLLRMNWYSGFGCYLPYSGVIVENTETSFTFRDDEGEMWRIELYPGIWGINPQLFVLIGDIGKQGGNVGFISWGGELILYLPKKYEILVKENDLLRAGVSSIAKKRMDTL